MFIPKLRHLPCKFWKLHFLTGKSEEEDMPLSACLPRLDVDLALPSSFGGVAQAWFSFLITLFHDSNFYICFSIFAACNMVSSEEKKERAGKPEPPVADMPRPRH